MGGPQLMETEVLNISPIVVWAVALSQLLTFGLTIWNLMASGSRANARKLDDHGKRIDDHGLRLSGLEQGQRGLPSKDDMHELELAMERLNGEMKAMSSVMAGNQAIMERLEVIVGRHESHLLDGSKR